MNSTKKSILENLIAGVIEGPDKVQMQKACDENVFYVDAIPLAFGGYSTGYMDDEVPCLYATQAEAQAENDDMNDHYGSEIKDGSRDADDEYEGQVLCASVGDDDRFTFYTLDDVNCENPIWTGRLQD